MSTKDHRGISRKECEMQIVLIDTFMVPEKSRSEFSANVRRSAEFLKTLSGYVEGFVYEKTDGDSPYNVVTTAVWESEEAFGNARKAAAAHFHQIGFNPQEIVTRLEVEMKRAIYRRSPY
jgi:heme-degrading monooxygenase HmoA